MGDFNKALHKKSNLAVSPADQIAQSQRDRMFIDSGPIRFFAPAERNVGFDTIIYHYIALRWGAK